MSLFKRYNPVISEAAALREVCGHNAAKKIARDFSVAVVTAKLWLAGRFPLARHDELAQRIRAELDRRDALSAAIRRQWAGGSVGETVGTLDSGRAVVARGEIDRLGGEVEP